MNIESCEDSHDKCVFECFYESSNSILDCYLLLSSLKEKQLSTGVLSYKKNEGACGKFRKEPARGTKTLFCGRGLGLRLTGA